MVSWVFQGYCQFEEAYQFQRILYRSTELDELRSPGSQLRRGRFPFKLLTMIQRIFLPLSFTIDKELQPTYLARNNFGIKISKFKNEMLIKQLAIIHQLDFLKNSNHINWIPE